MDEIITLLEKRRSDLNQAIKKAKKDEGGFPEGRLRINTSHAQTRYYNVTERNDTTGEYISKKNMSFAKKLAQKDYNKRFLSKAEKELVQIEKFACRLRANNTEKVYKELRDERKILIEKPYLLNNDLYAKEWQSLTFRSNPFKPENKIYETKKGETVRSKSEAIIADILFDLGIPYHYEMPLILSRTRVIYPDFTILKVSKKEEFYFEHFGMMDDQEYRNKCLIKINEYRENGIYSGKNLITTFESESSPLDIKNIRKMLKDFFV